MMFCKDLYTLLLYLLSYIECKFGNAAFVKFSQVMPIPTTHTEFTKLTETADYNLVCHASRFWKLASMSKC